MHRKKISQLGVPPTLWMQTLLTFGSVLPASKLAWSSFYHTGALYYSSNEERHTIRALRVIQRDSRSEGSSLQKLFLIERLKYLIQVLRGLFCFDLYHFLYCKCNAFSQYMVYRKRKQRKEPWAPPAGWIKYYNIFTFNSSHSPCLKHIKKIIFKEIKYNIYFLNKRCIFSYQIIINK